MDGLAFFSKYALNLTAKNFPVLTARRRAHQTTDMEIILLGDSHGWGQGSPGFDVILPAFSAHMAVPYSNGFYARLRKHIADKYGFYPSEVSNRELFHPADLFHSVSGKYHRLRMDVPAEPKAAGFYAPRSEDNFSKETFGYLSSDHKFNEDLLAISPEDNGTALCYVDMKSHATKLYIGVAAGRSGARLEIYFQHRAGRKGNTAGFLYRPSEGYPKVTRVVNGEHVPVHKDEVKISLRENVIIDTFKAGGEEEIVYCIDYGEKQRGRLCFAYAGAHPDAAPFESRDLVLPSAAIRLRGVVFDGNDVRNFSMGGHTVGQWLGDGTASFNDDSQPHVEQLLRFVPFTPTLVIIQAPIVNEYLRQTPIAAFTDNLQTLIERLSRHHNESGDRRTDFLLFTTPGDKSIAYEGAASAPIRYEDYYGAVGNFAERSGIGLVDFERYFRDQVAARVLDYEFLFDDPIHPSPFVNEFIARTLGQAIDLIM